MRGKGEGSIYQRSDGRWVGQIERGRDSRGRRRYSRVVRKHKADVIEALDELRQQAKTGAVPDRTTTVEQFLYWWLAEVVADRVTKRSLVEYTKRVDRLMPLIGRHRLGRLTVPHVQAAITDLGDRYARKTVATTLETLRAGLRWAVGADMIQKNPAEFVKLPRQRLARVDDTLTRAEADQILATARGDDLEALWWLALKYGLRMGELLALTWADIDDDELHVRSSKTMAGVRTLPLIPEARAQLRTHRRRSTVARIDGLVFPRPNGQKYSQPALRALWAALLETADIDHKCRNCGTDQKCSTTRRRFHASRHTAATLLLEAGVELEVVSAILGHSSIAVTAEVYAKVRSDLKRKGLEAL